MAGIGFELKKLTHEDTFIGDIRAYLYAGIVSSGPWIISILCLSFLWTFSAPILDMEIQKTLRVSVIYNYAFSLITTGMLQLVVTRFLADRLYLKQKNIFLPTYVGLIAVTVAFQGLIAVLFYSFSQFDFTFKIIGIIMYITISCIWQTMLFLSAARDFMSVVGAFVLGCFTSFVLAIGFGHQYGLNGYLAGFTAGQILIVFLLMQRVFYEFDSFVVCRFDFIRQIGKYTDLFLIGSFYYFGVWIDKIIYWFSPTGERIGTLFFSHYPYDSCVFLAYLTIIPALAHFLLDVEVNFYEVYKGFYGAIVKKGTFQEIERKKKEMVKVIYETGSRMLVLQTVVTALFLFYAPLLLDFLRLKPEDVSVIWAAGIGAYFHTFLVVILILIMYFDQRKLALYVSLCFLLTNGGFTLYVIKYQPEWMGFGYAASTFVTLVFGVITLANIIRNVDYLTFVRQPHIKPSLPGEGATDIEPATNL